MNELEKKFLALLRLAVEHKASDIHLATGQAPAIRSREGLLPVAVPPFTADEMGVICSFMVSDPKLKSSLQENQDVDGSFEVKGLGRFRFNTFRTVSGRAAVLRVIPAKIPSIEELGLPPVLRKIADAPRGLILVTGATGSGKSSTLAAMIDYLNETQSLHVLTVEDPIEYLHPQKKCRLSQRELGRDTAGFAQALRSALRQDPDVILVGEMRDFETLDVALKAAETGHLVFSTVHTADTMKTVGRLISLFPAEEQAIARIRLADNLHAIVSQRLVPGEDGSKVVAQEILINNLGIQECILNEKKTGEIPSFVEKGREVSGMQTFDQHLAELVGKKTISLETALAYASNPSDFRRNLSFLDSGSQPSGLETAQASSAPDTASLLSALAIEAPPSLDPVALEESAQPPPPAPPAPPQNVRDLPPPFKVRKPPGAA